jgi:hypothetical protein
MKNFWKEFRYYIIFSPLQFLHQNIVFGLTPKEQNEFMERFHDGPQMS